ncbi:LuxR family transcriptional regulator [Aceticella autotrophica]|uniref:LuxR family transcriptional regulator n=1 Tax=Aceticella autotrophica TaxID=2755338 RepID=A0A974Y2K3_9THEO|nr:helix-turn-helix transcriptional regulator [Aceticella autotrophica]QSZ26433.1 LuxR family transcriptional regulator [Aceticella autotrophica]
MEELQIYNEMLSSYKRCMEIGIKSSIPCPAITLKEEDLQIRLNKNIGLINVFHNCVDNILNQTKGEYIFLLTDYDGYLLNIRCNKKTRCCIDKSGFRIGTSFKEEAVGTNAISMAMKLRRLVYLEPQHHYCDILKKWYCIAAPIIIDEMIIGYLDVSTIEHGMVNEMTIVLELLADKIANEYKTNIKEQELNNGNINLTDNQIEILLMLAKGYKELAISIEIGIKPVTVKYHKRKIIEKLCVTSIQEAVAKAVKLNLIDIE